MNRNSEKRPSRTEYVRSQSLRLPTPPPDPNSSSNESFQQHDAVSSSATATAEKEPDFMDYLNSLPIQQQKTQGESTSQQTQNNEKLLKRAGSLFTPIIATEDAFDHLDKLYKLMEQLLNLREQNAKLQRRVRDLEHLKNLQNMDEIVTNKVLRGEDTDVPELDDDTMVAEAFLDNMLNKSGSKRRKPTQFRFQQSVLRNPRDRSSSVGIDSSGQSQKNDPLLSNNSSNAGYVTCVPRRDLMRKASKVSKWTKVKAAFKWEKASPTVTGAKSQDSGIGGMIPVNNEVARYLRVPSTCDNPNDQGTSPADSVLSGSWNAVHGLSTPGTLSSASSGDDLHQLTATDHRSVSRTGSAGNTNSFNQFRRSKTSDEEDGERRSRSLDYTGPFTCEENTTLSKDDFIKLHSSKSHKTPWGKVKDIIQTRKDSIKIKQHRLSAKSDDIRITDYSAGSDQEDVFEVPSLSSVHDTPAVTVIKSELSESNLYKIPPEIVARYKRVVAEELQPKSSNGSPRVQRRVSKWTKVKKAFLTSTNINRNDDSQSVPSSPISKTCNFFSESTLSNWKSLDAEDKNQSFKNMIENDLECRKLKEEIYKNYEQLQKKLSQEFEEKLHEWEKVKSSGNTVASMTSTQLSSTGTASEDQRDSEFVKKMEEWKKIKNQTSTECKKKNIQLTSEENLPADFRKKLQEWQKIKKFGTNSVATKEDDVSTSRKKRLEWQLWKSNSSNKPESGLQISSQPDRQYSEDFLKKLDEWKQIKATHSSNNNEDVQENRKSFKEPKISSPNLSRKSSNKKLVRPNKNHKMQEWLEKELQKIEREKQRLEREREKFLEREERLAKLRRSIGNNAHKKDVLVQTSTGFFRFEGISRKFTQRLYEWEKARGIAPEASTFNFLSSGFHQILPNTSNNTNQEASYKREQMSRIKLTRSKSMDSVANLTCDGPLITHQPSSLSLNDVDELEMQCLAETQSERNLNESEDNFDYEEPEAVIVEVEDFVEETAAPLELEPVHEDNHHTPIYQTQMLKLCESEKCEAPQVRRSESAKALSNYNLIQESLNILNSIRENEIFCKTAESKLNEQVEMIQEKAKAKNTGAIPKRKKNSVLFKSANESLLATLNKLYAQQFEMSLELTNKIIQLQDANIKVTKNVTYENTGYTISHLSDALNLTEDLSTELVSITENIKTVLLKRKSEIKSVQKEGSSQAYNNYTHDIGEMVELLIQKIKELKRSLSYICAASDMTAPGRSRKGSYKKREIKQRSSLEQISSTNDNPNNDTSDEEDKKIQMQQKHPRRKEKLFKSKSEDNHIVNYGKLQVTSSADQRQERTECFYQLNKTSRSQVHLNFRSMSNQKLDDVSKKLECVEGLKKKGYQKKKLVRSRRISDSCDTERNKIDEYCALTPVESRELTSNVIIPTQIQYLDATANTTVPHSNYNSAHISVFVHTTRKVFSAVQDERIESKKEESLSKITSVKISRRSNSPAGSPLLSRKKRLAVIDSDSTALAEINKQDFVDPELQQTPSRPSTPSHLPPLPNSPIFQRRERHVSKETSPAIRLMIARYNQKLSEQDAPGTRSGGSSGSASPVAWRSPVFERRVKAQTEKYQEEVNKTLTNSSGYSPLFMRKQIVKKSASIGVISSNNSQIASPEVLTVSRGSSLGSSKPTESPKLIRGILKSTSVGSLKANTVIPEYLVQQCEVVAEETVPGKQFQEKNILKLSIPSTQISENSPILQERAHKLQKAKEEFLSQKLNNPSPTSGPSTPSTASQKDDKEYHIHYPTRNRLSQVSFGSESSCDDLKYSGVLIKSASAGMINVDEETYEQFKPEIHTQGYVSLPRTAKKKNGKFGISSIASKFRKVKMRRNKDHSQMNTVSTLCRQSLVVDITDTDDAQEKPEEEWKKKTSQESSTSDINTASSTSTTKSSWIKIFKSKDTNK